MKRFSVVLALLVGACGTAVDDKETSFEGAPGVTEMAVWDDAAWQSVSGVSLPSSPHPYGNNSTKTWTLSAPSCVQAVRVRFSKIDVEDGYDFVVLKNAAGAVVQRITGTHDEFVSEPIAGNTIKVQLRSDWSVRQYGYDVVGLEAINGTVACPKILMRGCEPGTVDTNGPTPLCSCPAWPTCESLSSFSAELVSQGGFSGRGGGNSVNGGNQVARLTINEAGAAPESVVVATADKYKVQELARALLLSGFFDTTGDDGEAGNMTTTFTASFDGVTRSVSWPTGNMGRSSRWGEVVQLFNKVVSCAGTPEEGAAQCDASYACDVEGQCVDAGPTCDGISCEEGTHCALVEVQCIRAPCYPQPACVPNPTACATVRCTADTHCEEKPEGGAWCVPNSPSCAGIAARPCPGAGICNDDPRDNCDPEAGGADCGGLCACLATALCAQGFVFDSDPNVCACVPTEPEPGCMCPMLYNPVCGENDVTYSNSCAAACAQAPVRHSGACGTDGDHCGSIRGLSCQEGFRCRYGSGAFDPPYPDAMGTCKAEGFCQDIVDCAGLIHPMCYGNWSCEANSCIYRCGMPESWSSAAVTFGSASPYQNNQRLAWKLTGAVGATKIRVPFSAFDLEDGFDFVILYDAGWNEVARYTGSLGAFTSDSIPGNVGYLEFRTDGSVVHSGFTGVAVESLKP